MNIIKTENIYKKNKDPNLLPEKNETKKFLYR
jgi:hypothetical protein